jgi:tRNA A-37 threonylcarbamoyl transferase component Bud32
MQELTPKARPPWWAYLIGTPFVLDMCFLVYVSLMVHGPAGVAFDFQAGKQVVREILPGLPMDRAGVRPGDIVVAVDGQRLIDGEDWNAVRAQFEPEKAVSLTVERAGRQSQFSLVIPRIRIWRNLPSSQLLLTVATDVIGLICLALGLLLLFSRARHFVAVLGALVLFSMGDLIAGGPQYERAALFRHFPWPVQILIVSASFIGPYGLMLFFCFFPKPIFRRRWALAVFILPWMTAWFIMSVPQLHVLFTPEHATAVLPHWLSSTSRAIVLAYLVLAFILLALSYRRLEDANERRRVRLISITAVISFGAIAAFFFLLYFARGSLARLLSWPAVGFLVPFLWAVFPLAFAYALLRHRLFDFRLMVRQGLQYAFARHVLLALVPATLTVLILDLALHRDQTVGAILARRGWFYLAVVGVGYLSHTYRQSWLDSLDRRFFRERYNAQSLLREIVDEIRKASGFEAEVTRVVARIESALHPELVALLTRSPLETLYRSIASAPVGMAPPALSVDTKLISLVRVLGQPLHICLSESGWLRQHLPQNETDFLRESQLELIIPIALSPERTEALLVLGPKRSEEPYSREDTELLLAIVSALALLLERPAPQKAVVRFEECPKCGMVYDSGVMNCLVDDEALKPSALSRTLAGRYRLDQRLGAGGMGTVYRGLDTALEREIAVKLIREELIASADSVERFRREAKAAAAFSHPNLVTVYDFGVESGARAFLVMELLGGGTLRQEIESRKRLSPEHTLTILRGVCSALEAAHSRGLVHRDLKPENIFLARSESSELPKVLDFGLAKFVSTAGSTMLPTMETSFGILLGTPQYMSPEQLQGEAVNKSWDLWALAVIAYEMLAGIHPFPGATGVAWQQAILAGSPVPLRKHIPQSTPAIESFFAAALSPDCQKRPPSAQALLTKLEATLTIAAGAVT